MDTKDLKVAICCNDTNPESNASDRFARCEVFAIYDHTTLEFSFHINTAKDEMSGAGAKAARVLQKLDVDVVLVPEIGPKAYEALEAMDIEVYRYTNKHTARDVLYEFYENKLGKVTGHTKQGKH